MDIENLKEILASISTDDKQNLAVSIQLIEEIQSSENFVYLILQFYF